VSQTLFKARVAKLGARSWIQSPIALINPAGISIGDRVFIRDGARLEVVNRQGLAGGKLIIGNRVTIEQGAHIVACDEVIIEDDVCITPRCTIVDTTHPIGTPADGNRGAQIERGPSHVRIKSRAFLGANVVILPNVTIGRNSIIGANSVVTQDIPDDVIAAGAPARVIRSIARNGGTGTAQGAGAE